MHAINLASSFFWGDAPVVVFVRSKFVFFKARPIAFFPTGVSSTTFACSSRRRNVQRECPSGAGLHAISIRRASARPSSLRLALSELMFRYKVTMPSIPFVEYSFTVLVIVARHTALDFADCSWVRTFP